MKEHLLLTILITVGLLLLPGCSKKENTTTQSETKNFSQSSVKRDIASDSMARNDRSRNLKKAISINDLKAKSTLRKGARNTERKTEKKSPDVLKPMIREGDAIRFFKASTFNGETITMDDYKGRVILMDFWATWCRPCLHEVPYLSKLAKEYAGNKKFAIIGVSLDQNKSHLADFVKKHNLTYPHIFDGKGWKNSVARLYGVTRIPFSVLIDEKGVVIATGLRGDALVKKIHELVKS